MHLTLQWLAQSNAGEVLKTDFLPAELGSDATISDLKTFLVGSVDLPAGFPEHSWSLSRDGAPITAGDSTMLSAAGFKDGDFIAAVAQPHDEPRQNRALNRPGASSAAGNDSEKLEELRQHILRHPPTRSAVEASAARDLVKGGEQLADVLNNPSLFAERWNAMEDKRQAEARQRDLDDRNLDEAYDAESQAAIYKRIQQQQVQKDAQKIMEEHPEFFGSVTMLYINVLVNGHAVKAFVDSGAQMTVISPQKAEECGITRHIDERYSGIARGVGTARILGRVHRTDLTILDPTGYTENVPCSFTVMEGKGVDMLLGLDMLKRYRASVDLQQNALVFPNGAKLPFLPESEIPKGEFDNEGQQTSGDNSTVASKAPAGASSSAEGAASAASSFSGAGHTLGSGPAPSVAPSSASTKAPSTHSTASDATLVQPPAAPVPERSAPARRYPNESMSGPGDSDKINMLVEAGARSRDHAREVLNAVGGNLDMAMSVLFFGEG